MKNKHIVLCLALAFQLALSAQNVDSLWHVGQNRIVALEQQNDSIQTELSDLHQQITDLEALVSGISNNYSQTEKRIAWLEQQNKALTNKLDLSDKRVSDSLSILKNQITSNTGNINLLGDRIDEQYDGLNNQLNQTETAVQTNEDKRYKSVIWGVVIAAFIIVLLVILFLILRQRINKKGDDIEQLRNRANDLNNQIVERMDKELGELTKIVSQTASSTASTDVDPDHSLVKALADRITFMEMTLYRMDPSIKGHKHLTKSIKQMKDNLLANGYELIDMLGKDYIEGMKVTASFVADDNLAEGKQIITGITKPQINYKGKMIQAAQITVSQNI